MRGDFHRAFFCASAASYVNEEYKNYVEFYDVNYMILA